jgi:hypothetical protein
MDKAEKRKAMVANALDPNMMVDYLIVVQMDKAEKRKAMVANILDPNMDGPSSKKSRLDQFGSSSGMEY